MAYQVIARKWRPQKFEDVTGQEILTRTLRNSIEHGRLHHAYLFSGARGVGKTTTARLVAKALNCHKAQDADRNALPHRRSTPALRAGKSPKAARWTSWRSTPPRIPAFENVRDVIINSSRHRARA